MSDDLAGTAKQRETKMTEEESTLEIWQTESYAEWQKKVKGFEADDPRRLEHGHWTVSFAISPFETPTIEQLKTALKCQMPKYLKWRPFTNLQSDSGQLQAQDDFITVYLGWLQPEVHPQDREEFCGFWRNSRDGKGFMLRPMREDGEDYCGKVLGRGKGPYFDGMIPIYRMTEVLKFIEALGEQFSGEGARFELLVTYYKTKGRRLEQYSLTDPPVFPAECNINELPSRLKKPISDIATKLEELVFALLTPVYEEFDSTKLPRQRVTDVVAEVLA